MKRDIKGHSFEKAWDNWCVAQMARELGKDGEYTNYIEKAGEWVGEFRKNYVELYTDNLGEKSGGYEATRWQYRWCVFHDQQGIMNEIGGRDVYLEDLTYFFDDFRYNHGNQPDLECPWLFNFAGAPWLTQKWVRTILTKETTQRYGTHGKFKNPYHGRIYKADPVGFIPEMDDDAGTMSAWFVMGALGLYQVCVGEPVYEITAPLFESITIRLDEAFYPGKTFTIKAPGVSDEAFYIQSAKLNGEPLNKPWITHENIVSGGTLEYVMGTEPNKEWGASVEAMPPSLSQPE